MPILVTGGAGYIGSHMVYELTAAGERVVVLDNLSTGFEWAIAPAATLVIGDIGDQALVLRLIKEHGIDAIIHFAGSIVVPESVSDPLGYYRNNTVNSRALIECAVKGGVPHFIFSSTAAVYGSPEVVPVGEDAPLQPVSPYGWSKLMTEIMLRDATQAHGIAHVSLRYFNVAGADPQARVGQSTKGATHLIKVAVETALGRRAKMDVFGTDYPTPDGTCLRDYIHVTDLADAHVRALRRLEAGGASQAYNLGTERPTSVREIVSAVERVTGRTVAKSIAPRRAGDPAILYASAQRAREDLGWVPARPDIDTIVGDAWRWFQALQERSVGGSR